MYVPVYIDSMHSPTRVTLAYISIEQMHAQVVEESAMTAYGQRGAPRDKPMKVCVACATQFQMQIKTAFGVSGTLAGMAVLQELAAKPMD